MLVYHTRSLWFDPQPFIKVPGLERMRKEAQELKVFLSYIISFLVSLSYIRPFFRQTGRQADRLLSDF